MFKLIYMCNNRVRVCVCICVCIHIHKQSHDTETHSYVQRLRLKYTHCNIDRVGVYECVLRNESSSRRYSLRKNVADVKLVLTTYGTDIGDKTSICSYINLLASALLTFMNNELQTLIGYKSKWRQILNWKKDKLRLLALMESGTSIGKDKCKQIKSKILPIINHYWNNQHKHSIERPLNYNLILGNYY